MKYLITFLICVSCCLSANSQIRMMDRLIDLAGIKPNGKSQMVHRSDINKDIVLKCDADGNPVHIGISLFSDETKEMVNKEVCDFIERLFLELYVSKSVKDAQFYLKSKKIVLKCDGHEYGKGAFTSLAKVVKSMEHPSNFTLSNDGNTLFASIEFGIFNCIEIQLPASRELVTGVDKKEADDRVGTMLQNSYKSVRKAEVSGAVHHKGELYIKRGQNFVADSLRNDTYFVRKNGTFSMLYSSKYPKESILNLFQGYVDNDIMLNLKHRKYGGYSLDITVPLNNVISCFKNEYNIYSGIHILKNGKWQCIVIFKSPVYNYLHMLIATFDVNNMFNGSAVINADFFSNIPQDNIKTLF